jgi:hypothetical protein
MRLAPDGGPAPPAPTRPVTRALVALLRTVRLFGFLAWAYIAANSISHPVTMTEHLTHLANWPHENTFGALAFALSLVAAVALALRPRPAPRRRLARGRNERGAEPAGPTPRS